MVTGRSGERGRIARRLVWFGLMYAMGLGVFGAATLGLRGAIHLLQVPGDGATHAAADTPAPRATVPTSAGTAPPRDAVAGRARFDIVRIAPDGRAVIAGHAPPGSTVEVTLDGRAIGTAHADGSGSWLLLPRRLVRQGPLALAVKILDGAGGTGH